MAFEFRFPDVGEGIAEGEIVRWRVAVGDTVRADQALVEVETDKAVVEIPSPRAGTVMRLAVGEGEKIQVGDILVVIGEDGDMEPPSEPSAVSVSVVGALPATDTVLPPPPEMAVREASNGSPKRILAIPSVRKLARELGVDLAEVTPTGPRGRIRREDVLQASSAPAPVLTPAAGAPPAERQGEETLQPLPALRRTIAEAMARVASTAVPITTTDEADVTELVALRQRGKAAAEVQGVNVTLLPFIMKAVVAALRRHPMLNATLDDDLRHLRLKHDCHLGIATDTPDGLIVPVIRHVDQKNILTLAQELQHLTALARERRIPLADLRGGTFTISNYGAIGGLFATPMLHLPQVAILGVGRLIEKPVVHEGEMAIRTMLPLSLTFDHRAMDGAHAQRFLNEVMGYLSNVAALCLVL
jgi:pyruvate dehydrogenase E2 component (dihydrolipoamide acetyltransferase)